MNANNIDIFRAALEVNLKGEHCDVPMLPEVAQNVLRLTQDPNSEAAALAKLLQSDPTLAAKVMRVANSAAYSPNGSLVSLQQAIARLGMRMMSEIALAASLNSTLFDTPGYEDHVAYRIRFSLAAALWAKEVARSCRNNVEAAFLAGLLHDIGRPTALQATLSEAKKHNVSLNDDEVFLLEGEFRQRYGEQVMTAWGMPDTVSDCVQYFENYQQAHRGQQLTMTIVAGATLAHHFICESARGDVCSTREDVMQHPVFAGLNLYQDEIITLLEKESSIHTALEALSA